MGMLASSVWLQIASRAMLAQDTAPNVRLALLHAAIRHSELLLAAGAIVGLVGALALAVPPLWRTAL
jgi:hypothetical protein